MDFKKGFAKMDPYQRRGLLIILSSPSGAGKSSLAKAFHDSDGQSVMSISATTRPKRPAEIEGVHYFFIDEATFDRWHAQGDFLETAQMYGKKYGTPKAPVLKALELGKDVIFDIDTIGMRQISAAMPHDLVRIFILPPSAEELERRLRTRSQDSEESTRIRLSNAAVELSYFSEYDYVIVNHDLEESLDLLKQIIKVERLRRHRLNLIETYVKKLSDECLEIIA